MRDFGEICALRGMDNATTAAGQEKKTREAAGASLAKYNQ